MKKIITLTIECIDGMYLQEQCIRTIEIAEDDSLYSLHCAIQKSVKFGEDHLFTFYAGKNAGNEQKRFTGKEPWEESLDDFRKITLNQVYPLNNMNLYYLFDFGDHWCFEIRKQQDVKDAKSRVKYPRIVESIGANPAQYPELDEQ